jgi:hypothetical protein
MQKLKCALLALFTLTAPLHADDVWHLLIEPKFLRYESAWPIPGSDRTVLVPARMEKGEILPLKREEVTSRGVTREKILASAPAAAAAVLATLTPRYVRDDNKVIQYAVLESDNPLTASAVLAPKLGEIFARTLGPDLLVAIPNRNLVYVFPKQSPVFQTFADLVYAEYQSSSHPVSRELFEVRDGKLIAIGAYR